MVLIDKVVQGIYNLNMPRAPRIKSAGYIHHVICIGNDRQNLFQDSLDYKSYIDIVDQARQQYSVKIYNYLLMDNQIHLLIEPLEDGSLSRFMEYVSKGYAKYFNKKNNRVGHVFQGRFKSFLIQKERYFFVCSRYIDLTPVNNSKVSDPKEYEYSGYQSLAFGLKENLKLDRSDLYLNLGENDVERQIAYRTLVNNYQGDELDLFNRRAGILGDKEFKKQVTGKL